MSKFAGLELPVDEPFHLVLVNPTTRQPLRDHDGKEAYIDHLMADSQIATKFNRETQRRRLAMLSKSRVKLTPEELDIVELDMLSLLITGWYLVGLDGAPLNVEWSRENARELLSIPGARWIREQLDESVGDRGNFSISSVKK